MNFNKKIITLAMAAFCAAGMNAQTLNFRGTGHNNRTDDGDQMPSRYIAWNYDLGKGISIVSEGLYSMSWDGATLTAPVKEPPVNLADFYSGGQFTDNDKALWATNFNLMSGNSGAVYVNGKIITVHSRDEQSTTDDQLFAVRKWDAKTGDLLYNRYFPKSAMLESAGMAYNPKDGKIYGLFYITEAQLSEEITGDSEYFSDDDDADVGREGMDAGYAICTLDPQTMKVTPITPGLYYYNFITFAINSEGRAFALTSGGSSVAVDSDGKMYDIDGNLAGAQLCEFDLATGLMKTDDKEMLDEETGETYIERINIYKHGTGYSSQYRRQSACFDRNNPNIMYWNGYYNSGKGINDWGSWSTLSDKEWRTNGKYDTSLYAVDITTGEATRLAKITNRWTFSALWIEGCDPSDDADIDIATPGGQPEEGAYITLSTAENGGIWQMVELGQQYTYYLEPAIGWKLHSVTFNNQDVTNDVTANNMYTTPAIALKNNSLFVTFEQTSSDAVQTLEKAATQPKVLGREGGVSIQNAKAGDLVQVYSIDGRLLQSQKLSSSQADIQLGSKALYIIKVADKTVKVRL